MCEDTVLHHCDIVRMREIMSKNKYMEIYRIGRNKLPKVKVTSGNNVICCVRPEVPADMSKETTMS